MTLADASGDFPPNLWVSSHPLPLAFVRDFGTSTAIPDIKLSAYRYNHKISRIFNFLKRNNKQSETKCMLAMDLCAMQYLALFINKKLVHRSQKFIDCGNKSPKPSCLPKLLDWSVPVLLHLKNFQMALPQHWQCRFNIVMQCIVLKSFETGE